MTWKQCVLVSAFVLASPVAGQRGGSTRGDEFQPGDRIALVVEGEAQWTDTFTVVPGPAIRLPVIGAVSLAGVRRSDVERYLGSQLGRYLRNPMIHAQALMRLAVLGEVEHPGYYQVSASVPLSDLLMRAGGPTRDAKMNTAHIERDGGAVVDPDSLQRVLSAGVTIADLHLHQGDRVVVPRLQRHDPESAVRIVTMLVTLPVAVYGIMKLF